MPGMGLSVATAALVGQYLGAREPELAHLTSGSRSSSLLLSWDFWGCYSCYPGIIVSAFTHDIGVRDLGMWCLDDCVHRAADYGIRHDTSGDFPRRRRHDYAGSTLI